MGSKMNRWKVKKSKWFKNSMVGAPLVYTGGWHIETKHGERISFPTWREAMDYADRMARTVTVTLPRTNPPRPATAKYIVTADYKTDDYHVTILEYVHE